MPRPNPRSVHPDFRSDLVKPHAPKVANWDGIPYNLALALFELRQARGLSQLALSRRAGVPRWTISSIETGSANPSLKILLSLAAALQVSIQELLIRPRSAIKVVRLAEVKSTKRSQGAGEIWKLLPDPIPGMEIDPLDIEPGRVVGGVPHVSMTKEYLICQKGTVDVSLGGNRYRLEPGDLIAFAGDQPHAYLNPGRTKASCLSVVVLAPLASG